MTLVYTKQPKQAKLDRIRDLIQDRVLRFERIRPDMWCKGDLDFGLYYQQREAQDTKSNKVHELSENQRAILVPRESFSVTHNASSPMIDLYSDPSKVWNSAKLNDHMGGLQTASDAVP